ncbi:MAG: diguanylate cyclase [Proteobacteria bacterium]|nr:diguanylate cyclase [Pseudomonadota bacterium]MDA0927819.1 diguanylate cyclase [Pseudomonadota bacterium]
MKIKDFMSPVHVYHDPRDSLGDVVRSMADRRHSCALVCEMDAPVGIVTERDIVRLIAGSGNASDWFRQKVRDVMVRKPICVSTETELESALDLARSRSIRHLPVVDSTQRLVGVVTFSDLLKAYTTLLAHNQQTSVDQEKLSVLAIEDPLTGLPNRRAMEIDMRHASAIAQRRSETYAIALMEVDYFQEYSDHYGDEEADQTLKAVASRLNSHIRESDKLFRAAGQQFLLLMPFTPLEGAMIGARRLGKMIYDCGIAHVASPLAVVSVSIGVSACLLNEPWEAVMERADDAMHDAMAFDGNSVRLREAPPDADFWDLSDNSEAPSPSPG